MTNRGSNLGAYLHPRNTQKDAGMKPPIKLAQTKGAQHGAGKKR